MNARLTTSRYLQASAIALALLALPASAETLPGFGNPVKPRVMVIFDTSRSMSEMPEFLNPGDDNIFTPMSDPEGDFDGDPNQTCKSKFCVAKKVVWSTLPQYTPNAIIGLTSYYQYILKYEPIDTRVSTCTYDKLLPAGINRTFTSTTDLTGSGGTYPSSTATAIRPSSIAANCSDTPPNQYIITKIGAATGTATYCNVFSQPTVSVPKTFTSTAPTGCSTGIVYETINSTSLWANGTGSDVTTPSLYVEQSIGLTGTSCPAAVAFSGVTPLAAPSYTVSTSTTPSATAFSTGSGNMGSRCPANSSCALYSASSAYVARSANRSWYGYFNNPAPSPGPNYNGVNFATATPASQTAVYTNVLVGSTTGNAMMCDTTGRKTAGTLTGNWNINLTPLATHAQLRLPTGYTDSSPPSCSADWPCDITLVNQTTVTGSWGAWVTINNNMPAANANEEIQAIADDTNGGSYYVARKSGACPASPTPASIGMAGCGTGRNTCTVQLVGSGTRSVSCPDQYTFSSAATAPTTCSASGNAYAPAGGFTAYGAMTRNVGSGSCTTGTFDINNATGYSGTGCGGWPCTLNYDNTSTSTAYSGWAYGQTNPGGYTAGPFERNDPAGTTDSSPKAPSVSGCSAGSVVTLSGGALCNGASSCQARVIGATQTDPNGCGAEGNKACFVCRYQPLQYRWSRSDNVCNYTTSRRTYSADPNEPICQYKRPQWRLRTRGPDTYNCDYSAAVRRYDYVVPTDRVCQFRAVRTQLRYAGYNFTYRYTTKGGELNGTLSPSPTAPGGNYCGESYPAAWPSGTCPASIANCDSAVPDTTCRLRWGTGNTNNRFSYTTNNFASAPLCMSRDGSGISATAYYTATPAADGYKGNWCSFSGSVPTRDYKLISDWYEPARANALPTSGQPNFASGYALSWDNQTNKRSGWGGRGGTTTVQPTPSQVLITIPDDNVYDPTGQSNSIQRAMTKCQLPDDANMDGGTWAPRGVCFAEAADHQAPSWTANTDFTPLFGSITNTAKYLRDRLDTDGESACRGYFVVLATDGLENTPANRTDSDLTGLVASMRNTVAPSGNRTDVQTYVIGFGEGAAGAPSLDAMAAAGGTGAAYRATNLAALQTALSQVFNSITAGTFSRSAPTIATDGTRVYATQFVRGSNTPEWKGEMMAYKALDIGGYELKWEHGAKLNQQNDTARNVYTEIGGALVNFSESNTALLARLSSSPGFPSSPPAPLSPMQPRDVVRFIRNASLNQPYFAVSPPRRTSRLSDTVHSTAVVVGKSPLRDWGGNNTAAVAGYNAYQSSTSTRPVRVLFGANDGMLHSVGDRATSTDCDTDETLMACNNGLEAWSFVPSALHQDMYKNLSQHTPGVDGPVTVTDACPGNGGDATACAVTDWRTIALFGLREGGRSVTALNVTNPAVPGFLWNYEDANLGYTASAAITGRVQQGGSQRFVSIFGGGLRGSMGPNMVNSLHVVNAMTGAQIIKFTGIGTPGNEFTARPTMFRYPTGTASAPFIDSMVLGDTDGKLRAMRFSNASGSPSGTATTWYPRSLFEPTNPTNRFDMDGNVVRVMRVAEAPGPMGAPPVFTLVQDTACASPPCNLPLDFAPPIYNQTIAAAILDSTETHGDFYVGTGDTLDPAVPRSQFMNHSNVLYGVHDLNLQTGGIDGRALFVRKFLGPTEQVVGEGVIINGVLVVATYTPPTTGSQCVQNGDTILYAFNPRTGELSKSLEYTASSGFPNQRNSVMKFGNVGIPSGLKNVNGQVTFTSSNDPTPKGIKVTPQVNVGNIKAFRRVR